MELNDTQYLLDEALFTSSGVDEDKFSTEYLLNHSFVTEVEDKNEIHEHINTKNLKTPSIPVQQDIENILNNQDALIIQTHSAIHYLIKDYSSSDKYARIRTIDIQQNTIKTFLKVFENYCYFIRYYEYQLYLTNQDKYIRFLTHLFANPTFDFFQDTEDLNMFIEIVRTFVNEPTNIYMRLSKNILDKNNMLKASIIQNWNRRSKIYGIGDSVKQHLDNEIKLKVFTDMINKNRNNELESTQTLNKYLLETNTAKYFNLWKEKHNLADHYSYFGNELIKERVFKRSISENWKKAMMQRKEATSHSNRVIKKKIFEKLCLKIKTNKEADDKQKSFANNNLKSKFIGSLTQKHNMISAYDAQKNLKLEKEAFEKLIFYARLGRQADMVYFKRIGKRYLELLNRKQKLKTLERKFAVTVKAKYFEILLNKMESLNQEENFAVTTNKNFIRKRLLNCLKIKYEYDALAVMTDDKKALLSSHTVRTAFDKWRVMVSNMKNEKLLFYEKIYNNEVAVPVAKEAVFRTLLSSYMNLKAKEEDAVNLQMINRKKSFFNASRKNMKNHDSQLSRAALYRSQNVKDNYLSKWRMSLYITESHEELVLAFLNKRIVSDLSKILYNWNLKVMRNESMNTPLLTHRKRWKRAQLRGVLGVWIEKQRLKESEIAKQTIKTPFNPHRLQQAYNGTVERNNIPQRLSLHKTPINQNIYSSEFKSTKIREKKELLGNFTPHSRFSKDFLRPSPVKKQTLKTRLENTSLENDYFNSKDYILSSNRNKDNRYFRNKVVLNEDSFSTPISNIPKLRSSTNAVNDVSTIKKDDKTGFLPRLK